MSRYSFQYVARVLSYNFARCEAMQGKVMFAALQGKKTLLINSVTGQSYAAKLSLCKACTISVHWCHLFSYGDKEIAYTKFFRHYYGLLRSAINQQNKNKQAKDTLVKRWEKDKYS